MDIVNRRKLMLVTIEILVVWECIVRYMLVVLSVIFIKH